MVMISLSYRVNTVVVCLHTGGLWPHAKRLLVAQLLRFMFLSVWSRPCNNLTYRLVKTSVIPNAITTVFCVFQVWRHFRFVMPHPLFASSLEDTQIMRGATAGARGTAQSSTWLLRAGATGAAVGVQVSC